MAEKRVVVKFWNGIVDDVIVPDGVIVEVRDADDNGEVGLYITEHYADGSTNRLYEGDYEENLFAAKSAA